MESVHEGKKFKCEECGFLFTRKDSMKHHISSVHKKERKHCPYCSSLVLLNDFDEHIEKTHNSFIKCCECDYKSLCKRTVDRHEKKIHDGKDKPFKCQKCPYQASRKLDILNHKKLLHMGSQQATGSS